jgi:hypothetical protein
MTKDQLPQFAASTVLAAGVHSLLPQHLPEPWLMALLQEVDYHHYGEGREQETISGLIFAVTMIVSAQRGTRDVVFSVEELHDYITMYSIAEGFKHR